MDQEFATWLARSVGGDHVAAMFKTLGKLALAATVTAVMQGTALAQAVVSTGQSFVDARLLPGIAQEDGSRMVGLRLSLADGWKTYWRSPGEAGIPPHLDWSGSRNLASAQIHWPRPLVFQSFGMRTIGYADQVVLPVHVVASDPTRPVHLALEADFGVCKEICVIERGTLNTEIGPGDRNVGGAQIERALRRVPVPAAETGLNTVSCRIMGQGAERRLEAELYFDDPVAHAEVLVEGTERLWLHSPETRIEDGAVMVAAVAELPDGVAWVDRSAVRMTVLTDAFAADIQGCRGSNG